MIYSLLQLLNLAVAILVGRILLRRMRVQDKLLDSTRTSIRQTKQVPKERTLGLLEWVVVIDIGIVLFAQGAQLVSILRTQAQQPIDPFVIVVNSLVNWASLIISPGGFIVIALMLVPAALCYWWRRRLIIPHIAISK